MSTLRCAAARTAYTRVWSRMSRADRGKYLFRIARILQERAREFAVLETLDNGKPIKETRDVDIPLAAAHFFYHAGWADKLSYAGYGPDPRPHGVAAQIIPWNFPLLMLGVEDRTGPGDRATPWSSSRPRRRPLTALLFAEVCQQAQLPPGRRQHRHRRGRDRAAIVDHPGIDKIAFTGSTGVGKMIARSIAGTRKKATLELGGKARTSSSTTPPSTRRSRASSRHLLQPGPRLLRRLRLLVQESIADEVVRRLQASAVDPARRRSARQEHRRRGHQLGAPSSTGSPRSSTPARPRVPSAGTTAARCREGLLVPPTVFSGSHADAPDRPARRSSVRSSRC
jgi:aldehyde dehydrogenase (NAD+)